jgi:hypothetical protein
VPKLATVPAAHLDDLVGRVRAANPTAPLGVFILCSAGHDPLTRAMSDALGDGFLGGFFGDAAKVAASLEALGAVGIERVQVSPFTEASFPALAAHLFPDDPVR